MSSSVKVSRAEFLVSLPKWREGAVPPRPMVCFAGRSNVGKSSLLNALAGRNRLARVSVTPGRTQLINLFDVELSRGATKRGMQFADLPGYGFAKVPASVRSGWGPMVRGFLEGNRDLRLAVWLLDVRRDPSDEDLDFMEMLAEAEVPTLAVVTKADKVSGNERPKRLRAIAGALGLEAADLRVVSAQKGGGIRELLLDVWDAATA